jgi:hypothetical protein
MQPLMHEPAATAIGTQIVANGERGLAAGTAATSAVSAIVPAGADEVSAAAAAAFASEGEQVMGLNTFAQEELARTGAAVVQISGIYGAVDDANAAALG